MADDIDEVRIDTFDFINIYRNQFTVIGPAGIIRIKQRFWPTPHSRACQDHLYLSTTHTVYTQGYWGVQGTVSIMCGVVSMAGTLVGNNNFLL